MGLYLCISVHRFHAISLHSSTHLLSHRLTIANPRLLRAFVAWIPSSGLDAAPLAFMLDRIEAILRGSYANITACCGAGLITAGVCVCVCVCECVCVCRSFLLSYEMCIY